MWRAAAAADGASGRAGVRTREGKFANLALITPLAGTPAWPAYVTEEAFLSHDERWESSQELAQAGLSMTNRDVRLDRVVIRGHDVRKAYDWVHNC